MVRTTQKDIRTYVRLGIAQDITESTSKVVGNYDKVKYSKGIYGINGLLIQSRDTGEYYAITCRASSLFLYL